VPSANFFFVVPLSSLVISCTWRRIRLSLHTACMFVAACSTRKRCRCPLPSLVSSGAILIRFHQLDLVALHGVPNLFRVSQASCCPADLANMCIMDAAFSGCYIFPVQWGTPLTFMPTNTTNQQLSTPNIYPAYIRSCQDAYPWAEPVKEMGVQNINPLFWENTNDV
jgi:hypothetical protein